MRKLKLGDRVAVVNLGRPRPPDLGTVISVDHEGALVLFADDDEIEPVTHRGWYARVNAYGERVREWRVLPTGKRWSKERVRKVVAELTECGVRLRRRRAR